MEIIVGTSDIIEIEQLINVGATEFYAGLLQSKEYPLFNHRPNDTLNNFSNFRDLRNAINLCHSHRKKILLTVNELSYPPNAYPKVIKAMLKILGINIDGFIISDFYLLCEFNKVLSALKITTRLHLSSVACCFDSLTADFYKQFNIKRIIFPQHLCASEVDDILQDSTIETEVFYHSSNNCCYIDGRCHLCGHCLYPSRLIISGYPCRVKFNILNWKFIKNPEYLYSRWGVSPGINSYGNLYDFVKMGVTAIKVGIRDRSKLKEKVSLVKQLVKEVPLIKKSKDKNSFLRKVADAK